MREEEKRRVLEAVFGYSDSDDDDDERKDSSPNGGHAHVLSLSSGEEKHRWERVDEIKGLWLCKEFLTPEQQLWLLSSFDEEGWFTESSHNQAMRFGDLPNWVHMLSSNIRESCSGNIISGSCGSAIGDGDTEQICPFPMDLLWREPLFDQLIANTYEPGEGICAHVDLLRFEDGISIISLRSTCVMHFTRAEQQAPCSVSSGQGDLAIRIPVLLTPGSLVLMSGEARYLWKHEINRKPGFQVWEGKEIQQQQRTSLTLRKLCNPPDMIMHRS